MKLECKKCNYKFEKEAVPARCPYCSADGAVRESMDAQDILDEVTTDMDMMKDREP